MNELLSGYCENPVLPRKGPRIKREAEENFLKNKGTFNTILDHTGADKEEPKRPPPKVHYEGMQNREVGAGSVGNLLSNYGYHPASARPVPRVKFNGADNLINNSGSGASKTLQMIPLTSRPSSAQFFQPR